MQPLSVTGLTVAETGVVLIFCDLDVSKGG